jgi:hypothetical protein
MSLIFFNDPQGTPSQMYSRFIFYRKYFWAPGSHFMKRREYIFFSSVIGCKEAERSSIPSTVIVPWGDAPFN